MYKYFAFCASILYLDSLEQSPLYSFPLSLPLHLKVAFIICVTLLFTWLSLVTVCITYLGHHLVTAYFTTRIVRDPWLEEDE